MTNYRNRFIEALNMRDQEDAAAELLPAALNEVFLHANTAPRDFLERFANPTPPSIPVRLITAYRDVDGELLDSDCEESEVGADEILKTLKEGIEYPVCSCSHVGPGAFWYALEELFEPERRYREKSVHFMDLHPEEWTFLATHLEK